MQLEKDQNVRIWRWILLLALAYFILRGPWRAIHDSKDFLGVFGSARCWLHGTNPFAPNASLAAAREAGAVTEAQFREIPSVYLPPALVLFAPFAIFPWKIAKIIWIACSLISVYWAGTAVVRMTASFRLQTWSCLLAFAPLHTGLSKGQPSVIVCALIIGSMMAQRPYLAGALLGLATCIKPQLTFGFLLLALGLGQGRKLLAAFATGLIVTGIAMLRLPPHSITALISSLSAAGAVDGINSSSVLNPAQFQLINIDTLIPQAVYGPASIAIVYAVIAIVSAIAVGRAVNERIAVAVVASATVLVIYHRFYDAQILWLAVPVMFGVLTGAAAIPLWISLSVFLIPGQTLAATWLKPSSETLWSLLLLHHETLAALVIWLMIVIGAMLPRQLQNAGITSRSHHSVS